MFYIVDYFGESLAHLLILPISNIQARQWLDFFDDHIEQNPIFLYCTFQDFNLGLLFLLEFVESPLC